MAMSRVGRGRWAGTWLAVVFSALAMLATTFLHGFEQRSMARGNAAISTLRLARIDLIEGFLRVMPPLAEAGDVAEGQAWVRQAAETFEEAERMRASAFPSLAPNGDVADLRKGFAELSALLAGPPPLPNAGAAAEYHAELRIAFRSIERRMESLSARFEEEQGQNLRRLDSAYVACLVVSALILVSICAAIYAGARAEAAVEAALAENRAFLQKIIDNSPALIYGFDAQGVCVLANRPLAGLFGKLPEQIVGKTRRDWVPQAIVGFHEEKDEAVLRSGRAVTLEEVTPREGGERVFLTTKFPLLDAKKKPYIVCGIATDITEQKRTEERLRKALEEREVLLRELNHRTKNNMQVISSWLTLQARRAKDPEARSALLEAEARVQAMVLVYRKLYQGGDLSYIDLSGYIRDLVGVLASAYGLSEGRVGTQLDLAQTRTVIDVALPCGLIVNELYSNAIKHAFPGDRAGTMRFSLRRSAAGEVELGYADDGVGCPGLDSSAEAEGIGLKTIEAIGSGQLGGRTSFSAERGFAFTLTFADAAYAPRV